jgi:hypothetical protein
MHDSCEELLMLAAANGSAEFETSQAINYQP